jgi:purine-binding chemotaxis protein CheW
MRVLEKYCIELKKGFEDKDKLIPNKKEPIKFLENWIIERNKTPDEKDKAALKTSTTKKKSLYFTFKKGEKKFAIGLDQLVEVVNSKTIVKLPVGQDKFAGLLSLKGEIIPVLNNPGENPPQKEASENDPKAIIVMNIDENMVGLIADATEEVIELSHDEILELEKLTQNHEKSFVFCQFQNEKLFFLDIERAIAA